MDQLLLHCEVVQDHWYFIRIITNFDGSFAIILARASGVSPWVVMDIYESYLVMDSCISYKKSDNSTFRSKNPSPSWYTLIDAFNSLENMFPRICEAFQALLIV